MLKESYCTVLIASFVPNDMNYSMMDDVEYGPVAKFEVVLGLVDASSWDLYS